MSLTESSLKSGEQTVPWPARQSGKVTCRTIAAACRIPNFKFELTHHDQLEPTDGGLLKPVLSKSLPFAALAAYLAMLPPSSQALAQSEEYQPLGARIGGFLLYPKVEVQEEYNDNIFTTNKNEVDSWITRILPSAVLQSNWNNHALSFEVGGDIGFYSHDSDDDYIDFQALIDGRLDVTRATEIYVEDVGFERLHEDRGSDEIPGAAAEVWQYDRYGGDGGVRWKPNRLGVEVFGGFHHLDYKSLDLVGGGSTSGDPRDRNEMQAGLQVGYDFSPGYFAYVETTYDKVDYDAAVNTGGFNRDSDGYRGEVGLLFEATPLVTFDVSAGYVYRDYESNALKDVDGFSLRGEGTWFVTPLTTVGLSLYSAVEETTSTTAAGKLVRGGQVTVDHELLRNLVLDASLGYANTEYEGGSSNRTDNDFRGSLGATYFMNRNFYAGAEYNHTTRDSSASGQDYSQNVFMIRVGAQF